MEFPDGMETPGFSSLQLLDLLFVARGKSVLDMGCGAGLLGIAAAKRGAREVWATDADPAAVECAGRNAGRNGVKLRCGTGDLFEPVAGRTFDLIVASSPQVPAPADVRGPRFGGEDGLRRIEAVLRGAPDHLEKGGEILTCLVSLCDIRRFETLLSKRFRFRALPKVRREFERGDYDVLRPGLFEHICERKRLGFADFEEEAGKHRLWAHSYMAMLK